MNYYKEILPKTIRFCLFDNEGNPLKNILFYIELISDYKNNFVLGPYLTDSNGKFKVNSKNIINEIEETIKDFPSDYSSIRLDKILIKIENNNDILERIERLAKYYPKNAIDLQELSKKCNNKLIKNTLSIEKIIAKEIIVNI